MVVNVLDYNKEEDSYFISYEVPISSSVIRRSRAIFCGGRLDRENDNNIPGLLDSVNRGIDIFKDRLIRRSMR